MRSGDFTFVPINSSMMEIRERNINYNQAFHQALEKLNEAQRKAVDTIEGPVLVIAGPGTGKTQILAARVGNILQKTHIYPENILCLTYTDAGTIAMRERLLKFIGPAAYRVLIHTFHSFCNQIIQENLDRFGLFDLDVITEIEEAELFRELIDAFDKNHRLKRWTGFDAYHDATRLKNIFSLMKKENLSVEIVKQKADQYIADLPNREEYKYKRANKTKGIQVGDPKQADIDVEIRRMSFLVAGADEFPKYEEMLRARKRYTYDDMILWVLNEFKKDETFLLRYQERCHYFLVDEYQDTSGSQNEILKQLISFWDVPNVFVVGDDDQSIYRFQGASVENILSFHRDQEKFVTIVPLTDNYRSSQNILDVASQLIINNEERLIKSFTWIDKNVTAKGDEFAESKILPEIREYDTPVLESAHIALEIEKLAKEGVELKEIAVIYRNHRYAENISSFFQKKNIPVNIRRRENILNLPLTTRMIRLLEYIETESSKPYSGEEILFEILHYDFFQISPRVIARIALYMRTAKNIFWRDVISNPQKYFATDLFFEDEETFNALKKLSSVFDLWLKAAHNQSLQSLFETLINKGGIMSYVMGAKNKIWLLQELDTFFSFIKEETHRDQKTNLKTLLVKIKMMQAEEMSLEINKFTYEQNAVNLMSAHGAKGLEFRYVYMIGCNTNFWEKKKASNTQFSLPDNLVTEHPGNPIEEERRLFYVGITRAKENLCICYATNNAAGKAMEKSQFVAEVESSEKVKITKPQIDLNDVADFAAVTFSEDSTLDFYPSDENHIRSLLENYSMSVTHLSTYLKCPLSFYYQNLLRVPSAKNETMAFGSAVHKALEGFFKKMVESNNIFPILEELIQEFIMDMYRNRECFSDQEFKRRLEYGQIILPKYYAHNIDRWNKIVSLERRIYGVEIDGIPVNGMIDKIEFDGKNANVVDYKTGKFENSKKKGKFKRPVADADQTNFENQYGGDYWRQAVFYKLLIANDHKKDWNVVSCAFDFVEPDRDNSEFATQPVVVSPEDLALVREQIHFAWNGIQTLDFHGCNKKDCNWCNFVKSNFTSEVLNEEE